MILWWWNVWIISTNEQWYIDPWAMLEVRSGNDWNIVQSDRIVINNTRIPKIPTKPLIINNKHMI